ncbi:tripartite tricarboxylate transporter TctB family protein [Paeniglutamicibacter sp. ABSL32-1]|uniref:tripartite tricarboxylate transporter TctB family protein n=1 Tax=Paeniglutamicibacter quisquiliarum TaxID=2849498 RepID=UPI001C2D0C65|nr:tripartite tricarboxylate transporter TctB family protein [Paeniglutamicibacter quisquiliarum]MBV1780064.1 tripartite tricarboxylate transporter TctB family protein [Paeniglutamicibacter quisquiliarum]
MVSSPVTAIQDVPLKRTDRAGRRIAGRRIAPLVLFAFGVLATVGSIRLELGTLQHPGPGLWPLVTALTIVLSSIVIIALPGEEPLEAWTSKSIGVATGVASLCAFVVLFNLVGFFIPAVLMMLLWLRVYGGETLRTTIILSLAGPLVLHIIFDTLLGVPFPRDLLLGHFL